MCSMPRRTRSVPSNPLTLALQTIVTRVSHITHPPQPAHLPQSRAEAQAKADREQARILAEWLVQARRQSTDEVLAQLYDSTTFADAWYRARARGEALRRRALERLYTQRRSPGGRHPDPRQPAAFSSRAVLQSAAQVLGIQLSPVSEPGAEQTLNTTLAEVTRRQLAWIVAYPHGMAPEIALRQASVSREARLHFDVACLMGFIVHRRERLADPDAPAGIILLPSDPALVTLLHQFAIGLLCLPADCPPNWTCPCNQIRRRFNEPPRDHERPTDTMPALTRSVSQREPLTRQHGVWTHARSASPTSTPSDPPTGPISLDWRRPFWHPSQPTRTPAEADPGETEVEDPDDE